MRIKIKKQNKNNFNPICEKMIGKIFNGTFYQGRFFIKRKGTLFVWNKNEVEIMKGKKR